MELHTKTITVDSKVLKDYPNFLSNLIKRGVSVLFRVSIVDENYFKMTLCGTNDDLMEIATLIECKNSI